MTRDELIAKLEAATGPDRELDASIALEIGWTHQKVKGDAVRYWRPPGEMRSFMRYECPRFTGSIDAAMTLKPDGVTDCGLEQDASGVFAHWAGNGWLSVGTHETSIAIALCIAALKARADMTDEAAR